MSSGPAGPAGPAGGYDELTFEQLVALLEELIQQMASGEIGIEEATTLYEQANRVHQLATERLDQVRQRVERLAPPAPPS